MTEHHCPYCNFDEYDVIDKNDFGVILPEPHALSKGHCVIIPLRHVSSFFDVTDKERQSLMTLLELARHELQLRHQPAGFHIGFNDGAVLKEIQTASEAQIKAFSALMGHGNNRPVQPQNARIVLE